MPLEALYVEIALSLNGRNREHGNSKQSLEFHAPIVARRRARRTQSTAIAVQDSDRNGRVISRHEHSATQSGARARNAAHGGVAWRSDCAGSFLRRGSRIPSIDRRVAQLAGWRASWRELEDRVPLAATLAELWPNGNAHRVAGLERDARELIVRSPGSVLDGELEPSKSLHDMAYAVLDLSLRNLDDVVQLFRGLAGQVLDLRHFASFLGYRTGAILLVST
jgi:hypothetical protein